MRFSYPKTLLVALFCLLAGKAYADCTLTNTPQAVGVGLYVKDLSWEVAPNTLFVRSTVSGTSTSTMQLLCYNACTNSNTVNIIAQVNSSLVTNNCRCIRNLGGTPVPAFGVTTSGTALLPSFVIPDGAVVVNICGATGLVASGVSSITCSAATPVITASSAAFACSDINECAVNNGACGTLRTCVNAYGSKVCQCNILGRLGTTCATQGCYFTSDDQYTSATTSTLDYNTAGSWTTSTPTVATASACYTSCLSGLSDITLGSSISQFQTATPRCRCIATTTDVTPASGTFNTVALPFTSGLAPIVPGRVITVFCPTGFISSGTATTATCNALAPAMNLTSTGFKCSDINECATNGGGCDTIASCSNSVGSFSCTCPIGYSGSGLGLGGCVDVNECATSNGGCNTNAQCSNIAGSRTCSCLSGYSGNGVSCVDVNECAISNGGCPVTATCANSIGSFSCTCLTGYSGPSCVDVNECATSNGGCNVNALCSNTVGSRTCSCSSGYSGDGTVFGGSQQVGCVDVNECATSNGGCGTTATCINTAGSSSCDACGPSPCQNGAQCNNFGTSYTCTCLPGYSGVDCQVLINNCIGTLCLNDGV